MKKFSKRFLAIMTAFVLFFGPTLVFTDVKAVNPNEVIIIHTNDSMGRWMQKFKS